MAKKKTPTGTYEVGYAKTPVRSQFKKGQSGHPGGRKKGCRNFKTILRAVMELEIELTDGGKQRHVEMSEALLLRAAHDGINGDHKARVDLLDRCERYLNDPDDAEEELPEEDQVMLDAALRRRRK